jgi:hypothetical protein
MYRESIQWLAVFISIICSTFRALNLGHQATTYLVGSMVQIIFIIYINDPRQRILNLFYLITSLLGAWRWTYQRRPINRRLFDSEIV